MELLYFALPASLLVAGGFLLAFLWAANDDQFDDLDSPARRMLHDDAPLPPDARRPERTGRERGRHDYPRA